MRKRKTCVEPVKTAKNSWEPVQDHLKTEGKLDETCEALKASENLEKPIKASEVFFPCEYQKYLGIDGK